MKIFGVIGWKNSGKTGLVERLVTEFCAQGLSVSTLKHAHCAAEIDHPGRDTYRHREAGAREVILATPSRWALMHELEGGEPPLTELLARLSPVDLALIEGWKFDAHPKIECHRPETGKPPLAEQEPSIRALASTGAPDTALPCFHLDDTAGVAAFIRAELGL